MKIDFSHEEVKQRHAELAEVRQIIACAFNSYVYRMRCQVAIHLANAQASDAAKWNDNWKTFFRLRPKKNDDVDFYLNKLWPEEIDITDDVIDQWVYLEESGLVVYVLKQNFDGPRQLQFTDKVEHTMLQWVNDYDKLSKNYSEHPLNFASDKTADLLRGSICISANGHVRSVHSVKADREFVEIILSKYSDVLESIGVNLAPLRESHFENVKHAIKDQKKREFRARCYGE